ncbi:MAG: hypothetical protein ACRC2S_13805 [Waterburya sp.]
MSEFLKTKISQSQIDFSKSKSIDCSTDRLAVSNITTDEAVKLTRLAEEITIRLIPVILKQLSPTPVSKPNPLAYLKTLEEAYQGRWLLSTSELAEIFNVSEDTIINYGSRFEDAGFVFRVAGRRKGGDYAWSINKYE